jgi:hypothetical protein
VSVFLNALLDGRQRLWSRRIQHSDLPEHQNGSVANSESEEATMYAAGWELRGYSDNCVNELAMS